MGKKINRRLMRIGSTLMIITGIGTILFAILLLVLLGTAEMQTYSTLDENAVSGASWVPYVCMGDFITSLLGGIATLLEGILARKVFDKPELILPVWYISLLMVILRAVEIGFSLLQREGWQQTRMDVASLLFSMFFFLNVDIVRREAEKAGLDIY
ncbi:MAG: hypothetical protein IJT43_01205 [Stomatobaculum sp.]|nr:hypothetical protein [Stomatobaculum sp.]